MTEKCIIWGIIFLLAQTASAEEYLNPTCQSILQNDAVNLIKVKDVDGNGVPNIMVGTSINGILYNYVYKGIDCSMEWSALQSGGWAYDTSGDVKSFDIAGLDGDGKTQIVINMVRSNKPGATQIKKYVQTISVNGIDDWSEQEACGFTNSVYAADVDGTGRPNVIMGTANNKVCALKDTVKQKEPLLWSYTARNPVFYVKSDDIDGDGYLETVALANGRSEAQVLAVDKNGALKWEKSLPGGVYLASVAENIIGVDDIDGDGKKEIVVGTYRNGVKVYDHTGAEKWSYATPKLVSSILVEDITGDGKKEVLVGTSPSVIALDHAGSQIWTWNAPVDRTMNGMSAYDLDGDGKKEVAVGTTKYLYVIDDGSLKGSWKYVVEIRGLTKAYEDREANAVAVKAGDLDSDGEPEIVAGWNWGNTVGDKTQYSMDLRVYEINKNYAPKEEAKTTTTVAAGESKPAGETTKTTVAEETTEEIEAPAKETNAETTEKKTGMCSCLPMLPAIIAAAIAVLGRMPFAVRRD